MKKLALLILIALIASPAMAEVTFDISDEGNGWAEISYDASGETELPRAFGLDITTSGANIVDINYPGKSAGTTVAPEPFGIFPGQMVFNVAGDAVDDANTPVVFQSEFPGALGGLGTSGITVEMGSLYAAGATWPATENGPNSTGLLLAVQVDGTTDLSIAANEERAGDSGVILEDGSNPDTNIDPTAYTETITVSTDCFPSDHPDYTTWENLGKPDSWCYESQCYGDADGQQEGNPATGYYSVGQLDLNKLIDGWKDTNYVDEATDPWIAADFDHEQEGNPATGYYRVGQLDLNILIDNWKDTATPTDCLTNY